MKFKGKFMDKGIISAATALRHELHRNAELSNHEDRTVRILIDFLSINTDLELHDMGRWFYAAYHAPTPKKRIAFRADIDALPIPESDALPYHSMNPMVSHKCGHDGHAACLAAFALQIDKTGCENDVFFIFQNAEETGDGAKLCRKLIAMENIDAVYGFHNMPGFPLGAVMVHTGTAACASTGLILSFTGKKAHASQPENGKNPAFAAAKLILDIPSLISPDEHEGMVLCTVIRVDIGDEAFGTSAGEGKLMLTLRAELESELELLISSLKDRAARYCEDYGLTLSCEFKDSFPETRNHAESAELIRACCLKCGIPLADWAEPFRSSEDFGYYTQLTGGALFYIGDGEEHPALHTAEFDFPDELIEIACKLFYELALN